MWRKLRTSDVTPMVTDAEYGVAARDPHMMDTPFNGVVIIGSEKAGENLYLRLARPMAFAQKYINGRIPMLYAEVYTINVKDAIEGGDWALEVWEGRDGVLLQHRSGA